MAGKRGWKVFDFSYHVLDKNFKGRGTKLKWENRYLLPLISASGRVPPWP
jgi:hypothetical protein